MHADWYVKSPVHRLDIPTERPHHGHMTEAVYEPDAAERRVINAVKGLKAMRGISVAELCELLHISRATWFSRMNDGQFTVGQVVKLAERFGVNTQAILDGVAYSQVDDVRAEGRRGGATEPKLTVPSVASKFAVINGGRLTSPPLRRLALVS